MKKIFIFLSFLGTLVSIGWTQPQIAIDVSNPGEDISPTMYGVFFEDINFGADGGLYAELVKNRSFEFDHPLRGWKKIAREGAEGDVLIYRDNEKPKNARFARIRVDQEGKGFGLSNEGFRGMGLHQGLRYVFSVEGRIAAGEHILLKVELVGSDRRTLAEAKIGGFTEQWKTHTCMMLAGKQWPKHTWISR